MIRLSFPIENRDALEKLNIGDKVTISGTIYTARDAAHKRLTEAVKNNEALPFVLEGQAIYYAGPCPAPENKPIGSCGPTTSSRMDAYAPMLISLGQAAIIGKGNMSQDVINACKEYKAVYFAAAGGAGALIASCVKKCEVIAYPELLSEAIHKLEVKDLPLTVAIDTKGNDIFSFGRKEYENDK